MQYTRQMDANRKRHREMGTKGGMEVEYSAGIFSQYVPGVSETLIFIFMRRKLRLTGVDNWPLDWQFKALC